MNDADSIAGPRPSAALAEAASALLGRYAVSPAARVALLHQSENTMFLVRDPARAEPLVLRIHSQRMAYHTEPSIRSELQWMSALRADAGIETPAVVAAKDGSLVQTLAAPDLGASRLAVMFTYLEGVECCAASPRSPGSPRPSMSPSPATWRRVSPAIPAGSPRTTCNASAES